MTHQRAGMRPLMAGGFAIVFATIGFSAARADEVSDLRANNELLQQRLDQIAQTNSPGPSRFFSTDKGPGSVAMIGGSFPRSFLIPGTDTSIRVGGLISEVFDYWMEGGAPNASPQTTTLGDNGVLLGTPVGGANSARGSNVFSQSARQSNLVVETRTPTPYGEARTFLSFDFVGSNAYVPGGNGPVAVADGLVPRMKWVYGTLGGWLVGQANSNFSDSDANGETIDFGGNVGDPGVVRIPQIRYTMPLTWAWGGTLSFSAETPETDIMTPFGQVSSDCGVGCAATSTGPGVAPLLAVNPTKAGAPDLTAALYIPRPWGHFDLSFVLRPSLILSDGTYLSRTFMGYGGHLGFDFKPGWFTPKDDFIFQITAGDGIGRYLNAASNFAVQTNFKGPTTGVTTGANPASGILAGTTTEWGGEIGFQHWWSPNLRSNINFGINHNDISKTVIGAGAAAFANKELLTGHVNLLWNPVSFVTVGIEYMYGHRQVVAVPVGKPSGTEQVIASKVEIAF